MPKQLLTTPRSRPSATQRRHPTMPSIPREQTIYLPGAAKQTKCIIRKRSKNFQVVDGVLRYKGKGGLRQVKHFCRSSPIRSLHWKHNLNCRVDINVLQVVSDSRTKRSILEPSHNEMVGGCHFGRDMSAAKVSARYYWKTINGDVADWVCYYVTSWLYAVVHCLVISRIPILIPM